MIWIPPIALNWLNTFILKIQGQGDSERNNHPGNTSNNLSSTDPGDDKNENKERKEIRDADNSLNRLSMRFLLAGGICVFCLFLLGVHKISSWFDADFLGLIRWFLIITTAIFFVLFCICFTKKISLMNKAIDNGKKQDDNDMGKEQRKRPLL